MLSNTWLLLGWGAPSTALRTSFPTPTGTLLSGIQIQEFRVRLRMQGNGSTPDAAIELYETGGSTPLATALANTAVSTADPGAVVSGLWDAAVLSNVSGTSVEAQVVGNARGGSYIEIGALEWNAYSTTPIQAGFIPAPDTEFFGATVSAGSNNTAVEVSFENPVRTLAVGALGQEVRVLVRKQGAGASNPTVTLGLYEGASLRSTLISNQAVSDTTGTVISAFWNASVLSNLNGTEVSLRVTGTGAADARLEVAAVEWMAQLSEQGLVAAGFVAAPQDFYGARVYGPNQSFTAGFISAPTPNEFYGAQVRGPTVQASFIGPLSAGPYPAGKWVPRGVDATHELYGATVSIGSSGGYERVKPNTILAISGLSGVLSDIDDDPDEPDQSFLEANQ